MDKESIYGYIENFVAAVTREHPDLLRIVVVVSDGTDSVSGVATPEGLCEDCKREVN
jgi:hypothetical protein